MAYPYSKTVDGVIKRYVDCGKCGRVIGYAADDKENRAVRKKHKCGWPDEK
jgi:hypothetical protein